MNDFETAQTLYGQQGPGMAPPMPMGQMGEQMPPMGQMGPQVQPSPLPMEQAGPVASLPGVSPMPSSQMQVAQTSRSQTSPALDFGTNPPYDDVFKFMSSSKGKQITRAAVDAAIRASVKQGADVQTKDITDSIVRTARSGQ